VVIIAFSAVMAHLIERDFGKIDIQYVRIIDPVSNEVIAGKLYRPVWATADNPQPGIINLHGYQNDKDVQGSFSIELARRGFVVLAADALGHGDSTGYLGQVAEDGSNGANSAYLYLKNLPFVDAENTASMGHSMGGMETIAIAAMNPDLQAANPHASFPGSADMNNVLVTNARYEEFIFFRDFLPRVEPLVSHPARLESLGVDEPIEWDTTYGDFEDGSARRMALVNMDHHLLTLTNKAVAEAVDWMRLALKGGETDEHWIEPTSQIFMWKELFGLVTLLVTMFSLIPLTNLLLATPFFAAVAQPLPSRWAPSTRNWWLFATINALIGGVTYPILTAFGGPLSENPLINWLPFMRFPMGNGLALWFFVNAVIAAVLMFIWYRGASRRDNVTLHDLGAPVDPATNRLDWGVVGKSALLAALLFLWMYVLEGISQVALGQEFRFAWPYMRQFASGLRIALFFLYLIPALLFFLINGGLFLFGQARQREYDSPARTQWLWWLKVLYAALAGVFLVWLVQYIPWFFFGTGPGFETLGLPQYSGIWPLMLWVYLPEFAVLLFLLVWFYRRTGRIFLGALIVASLAMWFLAAGTVIAAAAP
jgi:hypothetical protein